MSVLPSKPRLQNNPGASNCFCFCHTNEGAMHVIACCVAPQTFGGIRTWVDPAQPIGKITLVAEKNGTLDSKTIQLKMTSTEEIEAERDKLREENANLKQALNVYLDAADAHWEALSVLRCAVWGHNWGDYGCEVCFTSYREWRDASSTSRQGDIKGQ